MFNRRQFLQTSLASSASLLAACSSVGRLFKPRQCTPPKAPGTFYMDAHSHVFNAQDIDITGYALAASSTIGIPDAIGFLFKPLIRSLANVLITSAPRPQRERDLLGDLLAKKKKMGSRRPDSDPVREAQRFQAEVKQNYLPIMAEANKQQEKDAQEASKCLEDDVLRLEKELHHAESKLTFLQSPLSWLLSRFSPSFLSCMTSYRFYNALKLIERFPMVDTFGVASLDFDTWYKGGENGPNGEDLEIQLEVMSQISQLTDGRIMPFMGWCPLRQVLHNEGGNARWSPNALLAKAREKYGVIGAKLYPVLGFRGSGNSEQCDQVFGNPKTFERKAGFKGLQENGHNLGPKLDDVLWKLYEKCNHEHLPIMAHTSHSFGLNVDQADPKHWAPVVTESSDLSVNLAHCGSLNEDLTGFGDWPKTIAGLAARQDKPNRLYTDVADVTLSMMAPDGTVCRILRTLQKTFPGVENKIIYGSDWHELLAQGRAGHGYFERWSDLFLKNKDLEPFAKRFLGLNAANFLGLHAGSKNREILTDYYARHNIKPAWMQRLNQASAS